MTEQQINDLIALAEAGDAQAEAQLQQLGEQVIAELAG